MGSHEQWLGSVFLLLAARTCTHTEPPNVTCEETVYGPSGDSNQGPLAYCARTQTTELHAPSTCDNFHPLNKIHPRIYSEPCWSRRDSPFAARSPNMDPNWATKCQRGGKNANHLYTGWGLNRDTLHTHQNLYRAAIKAGLYRKAVQVCYKPNTNTYSGIQLWVLTAFCRWFISNL